MRLRDALGGAAWGAAWEGVRAGEGERSGDGETAGRLPGGGQDEVAERKREERWAAIDKFREDSKSKKFFRDKKLADLENKHDRERRKRDNEYRGRRKVCATEAERLQLDARFEALSRRSKRSDQA